MFLGLVIVSTSTLPRIKKGRSEINETNVFIKASHKRHGFQEHVIDVVIEREGQLRCTQAYQQKSKRTL